MTTSPAAPAANDAVPPAEPKHEQPAPLPGGTQIIAAGVDPVPAAPALANEMPATRPAEAKTPEPEPKVASQAEAAADKSDANLAAVAVDGKTPPGEAGSEKKGPSKILVIDIGGTKVKILATGHTDPRKAPSGKDFTPARLVEAVRGLAHDWEYEAITIGYPGLVGNHGPRSEPGNLGPGWVGFDFPAAFGLPVKMVNDAAMQALGSYEGGRMLFLGLGTGLGSALIAGHMIVPLELGNLLYDGERTLGQVLGRRGYEEFGKGSWRKAVNKVVTALQRAFIADYVVIGGGNAKNVKELPPGARRGHNLTAFRGGLRLWSIQDVWVLAAPGGENSDPKAHDALRML